MQSIKEEADEMQIETDNLSLNSSCSYLDDCYESDEYDPENDENLFFTDSCSDEENASSNNDNANLHVGDLEIKKEATTQKRPENTQIIIKNENKDTSITRKRKRYKVEFDFNPLCPLTMDDCYSSSDETVYEIERRKKKHKLDSQNSKLAGIDLRSVPDGIYLAGAKQNYELIRESEVCNLKLHRCELCPQVFKDP